MRGIFNFAEILEEIIRIRNFPLFGGSERLSERTFSALLIDNTLKKGNKKRGMVFHALRVNLIQFFLEDH